MATLDVPLHLPVNHTKPMLERELRFRDVTSVKVVGNFMRIEHDRKDPGEIIRDLDGCHEPLTFV